MEASEAQRQGHGRPYLSSWGEEEKVLHVSENSRLVQVEKKKKKKNHSRCQLSIQILITPRLFPVRRGPLWG